MNDIVVLNNFPFQLDAEKLSARVHLPEDDAELRQSWQKLFDKVQTLARPKALYRECAVDYADDDTVVVEGIPLKSRVMVKQLGDRRRVFAYCATCGTETLTLDAGLDPLERFWIEDMRLDLLRQALGFLHREITRRNRILKLAGMAPGSGDADVWPLSEQTKLFGQIFENRVTELIGVELTGSLLMQPAKSSSGVLFASEHDFATCQLCHRDNCPNRRAPFDAELWRKNQLENAN